MRVGARGSGYSWLARTCKCRICFAANYAAGCGLWQAVEKNLALRQHAMYSRVSSQQANNLELRSAPVLPTTCHRPYGAWGVVMYDQDTPYTHACDTDAGFAKRHARGDMVQ